MKLAGAMLLVVLVGAGCSKSGDALGAGADLDACGAYPAYNALDEPSPEEPDEVRRYVDGFLRVLDRVEVDEPITVRTADGDEDIEVPEVVIDDLTVLERTMTALRDRLEEAGDDQDGVAAALAELARDEAFTDADARMATFHRERCEQ